MKNLIHAAIPAFLGTIAAEAVASRLTGRGVYEPRDTATSLAMGIINVALEGAMRRTGEALLDAAYRHRVVDVPLRGAPRIVALTLAEDLMYYVFHRAHHEVRILWAAHVNHHSSEEYNLSTALRQSWLTPLTKLPFAVPLALVGFTPAEIKRAQQINLLWQYWVHTQLVEKLGPVEEVMSTPSHHRVHHGSNLRYLDRNYGGIFIVWDRLFGTFEREDAATEPVRYGILHNLDTHDVWEAEVHEFRDMLRDVRDAGSLHEAFMYVFGPPGWSSDGSRQTVTQMRRAAE